MEKRSFIDRLFSPLGLTLLAIFALIPGTWSLPLIDPSEPRFAHTTVEMMEREEWVVPYFNDEHHLHTPPLTYWWMRANFAVFGINEFGARMHSVQASFLISLLLFFFARRIGLDRKMAFLAGAGWLTTLLVLLQSRLAIAEMPLLLFIVLTMATLHQVVHGHGRPVVHYFLLTLWLALAFLAKGPLAYAIPQTALLITFAVLWWQGQRASAEEKAQLASQKESLWKAQKALFITLIPSLALIAIWGVPAFRNTEGAFLAATIGQHESELSSTAMSQRFFIPGIYYLLLIIPLLLPWSAQLPATLKKSILTNSLDCRFLLGWLAAPFLLLPLQTSQLPLTILPAYPAFFLLLAITFRQQIQLGRFGRIVRNSALIFPAILGLLLVAIGLSQVSRGKEALDLAFMLTLLGAISLSLAIIGAATLRREKIILFAIPSAFAAFTIFFTLTTVIARHAHLTLRLKEATGIPVGSFVTTGYSEPSLVWYFDDFTDKDQQGFWSTRPLHQLTPEEDALTVALKRRWQFDKKSAFPLLSLKKNLPPAEDNTTKLLESFGKERIEKAEIISGWSPATSSWVEVLVLRPN